MGILDEAIREHLDLKRRRGADLGEVARQEGEVFGPSRRAAAEAPEVDEFATEVAAEQQTHLRLADDAGKQPYVADEAGSEPVAEAAHVAPLDEREQVQPPSQPQPQSLGQETRAFDPAEVRAASASHDEPGAEEEGDGEDVLEETPEFLAETPEHDRLWFEQRPPRDFDF